MVDRFRLSSVTLCNSIGQGCLMLVAVETLVTIYRQLTKLLCISMAHNANRQETHGNALFCFKFGSRFGTDSDVAMEWDIGEFTSSGHRHLRQWVRACEWRDGAALHEGASQVLSLGVNEAFLWIPWGLESDGRRITQSNNWEQTFHEMVRQFHWNFLRIPESVGTDHYFFPAMFILVQHSSNRQVIKTESMSDYVTFVWWTT